MLLLVASLRDAGRGAVCPIPTLCVGLLMARTSGTLADLILISGLVVACRWHAYHADTIIHVPEVHYPSNPTRYCGE